MALEHLEVDPGAVERLRGGEAGRPGADDADDVLGQGRLVLEQRVAVLAALVGELGDRGHALVVVGLDLAELRADAAGGAGAEGVGDVALLARGLDALVLEDRVTRESTATWA